MIDKMFRFEIEQIPYDWIERRPKPPQGYIEFNYNRANCQSGKCPNCGVEKPGTGPGKRKGGFHDRQIQNLYRALERIDKLGYGHPAWKPSFELFSLDIIPEKGKLNSMLKCHPSRYGIDEFLCCGAQIWHDFFDNLKERYPAASWRYYYYPTLKNNASLQRWF